MKKLLRIVFALLLPFNAFSQSQDSIQAMADAATKMFTWEVQKVEKGSLMFLDVAYQRENVDSQEYLTLTVAKNKSLQRPDFISIILPSNIVQSNGIFIAFANSNNSKNGKSIMALEKANPLRVSFEKCGSETCTARIVDCYLIDEKSNGKIDLLQKFMDFDHVLFLFIYPDGTHKSVAVPLSTFKKQYKDL
jgi:hypothetical protein